MFRLLARPSVQSTSLRSFRSSRYGGGFQPSNGVAVRSFFWGGDGDDEKKKKKKGGENKTDNDNYSDGDSSSSINNINNNGPHVVEIEPSSSSSSSTTSSNFTSSNSNNNNNNSSPSVAFGDAAPKPTSSIFTLPHTRRPLFPGVIQSLTITDPATIKTLLNENNERSHDFVGVFLRQDWKEFRGFDEADGIDGEVANPPEVITSPEQLYDVGTFAQIHSIQKLGGDDSMTPNLLDSGLDNGLDESPPPPDFNSQQEGVNVLLVAHRRCSITNFIDVGPPLITDITHWERERYSTETHHTEATEEIIKALQNEIYTAIRELVKLNPVFREHVNFFSQRVTEADDPYVGPSERSDWGWREAVAGWLLKERFAPSYHNAPQRTAQLHD